MTIAQQLKITTFPFEIKDKKGMVIYHEESNGWWVKREYDQDGNEIYYENSSGHWCKREFDQDGNVIYFEDSDGYIRDTRPKPKPEPVQTAVGWLENELKERYSLMNSEPLFEQAKAMEEEQIINSNRDGVDMVVDKKPFVTGEQYYNENYGGDK
jgi:signal peptidase I